MMVQHEVRPRDTGKTAKAITSAIRFAILYPGKQSAVVCPDEARASSLESDALWWIERLRSARVSGLSVERLSGRVSGIVIAKKKPLPPEGG